VLNTNNPVDLTNVQGQINVNVNYDPGTTTVTQVSIFLQAAGAATGTSCGSINIGTASSSRTKSNVSKAVSKSDAATGAVQTLTLTCNTAAFDTTQTNQANVTTWKNGQYTLGAKLVTTGTTAGVTTTATQPVTLNNGDWIRATFASPATTAGPGQISTGTAPDTNGLLWHAGSVNTKVIPILYTAGRSIVSWTETLVNAGSGGLTDHTSGGQISSATGPTCGAVVATQAGLTAAAFPTPTAFPIGKAVTGGPTSVAGVTADSLAIAVVTTDNLGNAGPTVNAAGTNCATPAVVATVGVAAVLTPATINAAFVPAPSVVGGVIGGVNQGVPTGNFIRLDNAKPPAGAYVITQNNFVEPDADGQIAVTTDNWVPFVDLNTAAAKFTFANGTEATNTTFACGANVCAGNQTLAYFVYVPAPSHGTNVGDTAYYAVSNNQGETLNGGAVWFGAAYSFAPSKGVIPGYQPSPSSAAPIGVGTGLAAFSSKTDASVPPNTIAPVCGAPNFCTVGGVNNAALVTNGDSNGVGRVKVIFQSTPYTGAVPASSAVWTTVTAATQLPATSSSGAIGVAGGYNLRMIEYDTLGNADTTSQIVWGQNAGVTTGSTGNGAATFGIDVTPPVTSVVSGPTNGQILGVGQFLTNTVVLTATDPQDPKDGASGSGFIAAVAPTAALTAGQGPVQYLIQGLDGLPLSGKSAVTACGSGPAAGNGSDACGQFTFAPTTIPLSKIAGVAFADATADGDWALQYSTFDQAGNSTATNTIKWYIDRTPPLMATCAVGCANVAPGDISLPLQLDSTFTFVATGSDSMNIAGGNIRLQYAAQVQYTPPTSAGPVVNGNVALFFPATASAVGVALSQKSVKSATLSGNLTQWYRTMYPMNDAGIPGNGTIGAGGKPVQVGIRAVDAANNLSEEDLAAVPGGNVSGTGATPYATAATSVTPNITDFFISAPVGCPACVPSLPAVNGFSAPVFGGNNLATVSVTGATAGFPTSTTITASAMVPSNATASPFADVCFYYQSGSGPIVAGGPNVNEDNGAAHPIPPAAQNNTGAGGVAGSGPNELVLIGCSSTPSVTVSASNVRTFSYTSASFTPDARFLVSGVGYVNIYAIGSSAAGINVAATTPLHDGLITPVSQLGIMP
jgi:hypothetical protein